VTVVNRSKDLWCATPRDVVSPFVRHEACQRRWRILAHDHLRGAPRHLHNPMEKAAGIIFSVRIGLRWKQTFTEPKL
jgi:hypothetical protein